MLVHSCASSSVRLYVLAFPKRSLPTFRIGTGSIFAVVLPTVFDTKPKDLDKHELLADD